jgi:hypothetical protein
MYSKVCRYLLYPSKQLYSPQHLQYDRAVVIKRGRESLPGTTKAKLASPLRADHRRRYWTPKDPKARLTAELGLQVRTLHERDPGVRARASRQEGVQSGHRHRRYQLDGDKLASANSTEAACQESSPRFHMSQVDYVSPNGRGNRRFRNLLRRFLKFSREMGRKR